jgi:hypothetical protein
MADYVTLVGAEDVRSAGNTMRQAADTMGSAVGSLTWALEQHQRFMDDWLQRLDATLQDRISDFGVTMGPLA